VELRWLFGLDDVPGAGWGDPDEESRPGLMKMPIGALFAAVVAAA
jgi:hypothetical protein